MLDNSETLVEISDLRHTYKAGKVSLEVLHGIDLTIKAGSNVFLTGYSGSGKTTLISLIGCLRSVQQGRLKLLGEELNGANEAKLIRMRRRIGYVFQHFNLPDFMTIRQNVQQSLKLQNNYSAKQARYLSEEMLDKVGLGNRVNAYPPELSGGQKQRVAIARALIHKPQLVLADEPTAALDSVTGREIIEIFQKLVKEQNSAALIVTHNTRILDSADEIFQMEDGRLGIAAREQISLALPTLKDYELEEIAEHSDLKIYPPGEIIIRQGDIAKEFFILFKGEVEIVCTRQNGQEAHITYIRKRGEYFGEMGLLHENTIRTATVRAVGVENVKVLAIERDAFLKMVSDSRQTQAIIRSEMIQRLRSNNFLRNMLIIIALFSLFISHPLMAGDKNTISALGFAEPQGGIIRLSGISSLQGTGAVVSDLRVGEGDTVEKGQIIALLDNYQIMQAGLKQAEAEVAIFKARLAQVKAGAGIAKINVQKARIERLKIESDTADSKCGRAKILQDKQAISRDEQEDVCLKKMVLKGELHEAQATLTSIAEVRDVDVDVAEAELEKAEAVLLKTKAELERAIVRSPVDGRVLKLHARIGELIGTNGLLEIGQTKVMWIRAEVYETDIAKVRIGQQATISSDVFVGKLQGTVAEIGLLIGKNRIIDVKPSAQSDSRVVEVKIRLSENDSPTVSDLTNLQVTVVFK